MHSAPWVPLLYWLVAILVAAFVPKLRAKIFTSFMVLALILFPIGMYLGLVRAPPDREMGDVMRIIYCHVPSVWMALLAATVNVVGAFMFLMTRKWGWDSIAEASAEVGVLFGTVGVSLGAIWAKPTWGVWWTWDARLTSAAVMLVAYMGYLTLRRFVDDPEKRAIWSAVVGIIAYVDIPIIWFSVKWWNTLHQVQSSPKTVDPDMTMVLRWNAGVFLLILSVFLWHRYRIAQHARQAEVALPEALPPRAQTPSRSGVV
ncbi:MAG: cytochrome c biogenesis protein CcsA [Myxococcaceae bacterium]